MANLIRHFLYLYKLVKNGLPALLLVTVENLAGFAEASPDVESSDTFEATSQ
jgi:hypothetical protein